MMRYLQLLKKGFTQTLLQNEEAMTISFCHLNNVVIGRDI